MKSIASVLLIAVSAAMVLASDIFLRAQGLDGKYGIDARSWDIVGTVLMGVGIVAFVANAFSKEALKVFGYIAAAAWVIYLLSESGADSTTTINVIVGFIVFIGALMAFVWWLNKRLDKSEQEYATAIDKEYRQ